MRKTISRGTYLLIVGLVAVGQGLHRRINDVAASITEQIQPFFDDDDNSATDWAYDMLYAQDGDAEDVVKSYMKKWGVHMSEPTERE